MSVFKTIPPEDQTITPFKVYKSWEYTGTWANRYSELTSQSIFLLNAIKPTDTNFSNGIMPLDFEEETDLDPATSLLNINYKFIPAGVLWQSLKHQYFNDYNGQINFGGHATPMINKSDNLELWSGTTFKSNAPRSIKTYHNIEHSLNPSSSCELQDYAAVISIPQSKFGEEIKPGSLQITTTGPAAINLIDDGNGNLIDTAMSSAFKLSNRILRLGFDTRTVESDPRYPVEIETYNTTYDTSFLLGVGTIPIGQSIYLSESYVRINGTPSYFNPRTLDNYAISFWFQINDITPGHGRNSHIISKRSLARNYQLINSSGRRVAGNIWRPNNNITPYDIYVTQAGRLSAQVGDGITLKTLTYATLLSDGDIHHVVFQKSGSVYQLWVDGALADSETADLVNIKNDADIFIGCKGLDIHNNNVPWAALDGAVDEVQFYNTNLTSTEIGQLASTSNNFINSGNVGKVFYKEGIIVITSPTGFYGAVYNVPDYTLFPGSLYNNGPELLGGNYPANDYISPGNAGTFFANTVNIKWNSTLTLYENEVLCRINEEEFNFTLNPSILKDSENGQLPKEFIYNDEFGPYITTIGLYNENAELLAIGKLGGPIKKRSNVDLNIIVRFDQ